MADYKQFCPTMWADKIETALERAYVFADGTNRSFEGLVSEMGDRVKILGVGRPTIHHITTAEANDDIVAPEQVNGSAMFLDIDQIAYFNVIVGDVDKAQGKNGVMDKFVDEGAEGLANDIDTFIANLILDDSVIKLNTEPVKISGKDTVGGSTYILDQIDLGLQKLRENDVKGNSMLEMIVSPRFYTMLLRAYVLTDTNNSAMMKNGYVGKYNGIKVKVSNNVATTDDGATDNIMLRTTRAIAYVNQLSKVKAYEVESKLPNDAVKAFELYGAKVVRPKEIVNINVKYA